MRLPLLLAVPLARRPGRISSMRLPLLLAVPLARGPGRTSSMKLSLVVMDDFVTRT
jgi:hypothetical protein